MQEIEQYAVNQSFKVESAFVGNERQKILTIDNFLTAPQVLVDFAAKSDNYERYSGHCNFYPGVKLPAPVDYSNNVMEAIKPVLIREYSGISSDWEMNKANCSISLITVEPDKLRKVQLMPHFDSANPYQFAILLFLCDERHGGTAFYRHNATGFETITQQTRTKFEEIYFKEIEAQPLEQKYFTESDERFTKIGVANAKFNRLIVYRSCLLHSPYIDAKVSVNPDPLRGRLTVNSFVAF